LGDWIYVTAENDNAVTWFQHTGTGLANMGCIADGGSSSCTSASGLGLAQAKSVAFDPTDDTRIYVAAYVSNTVRAFDANTTGSSPDGSLTAGAYAAKQCLYTGSCTQLAILDNPHQIALNSVGDALFVANRGSSSVALINTAAMTGGGCFQDNSISNGGCTHKPGLLGAHSVAVHEDAGEDSLFVTSRLDGTLTRLTF
jgi:DNA-binding beta-propeller fold protein YncE